MPSGRIFRFIALMGLKMRTKFARQSGVSRIKLSSCRMFEAEMRFRLIKNPDAIRRDSEMLVSVVMIMMVLMKMIVMMVVKMPLLLLLVALM